MTSVQNYRRDLKKIVHGQMVEDILELGVENGRSTFVFLGFPKVKLTSIDNQPCEEVVEKVKKLRVTGRWNFIQADVNDALEDLKDEQYDMVFMDITYYDSTEGGYGTQEGNKASVAGWRRDIKRCFELVREGGVLVISDYVNTYGRRPGPGTATDEFMIELDRSFKVYPGRGGLAVIEK